MDNNQPQDLLSAQNAAPVERAEMQADPFSGANHASLPGSPANEQYMIGNEYNQGMSLDTVNQGVSMGGDLNQPYVGSMTDAMSGVYPNPIEPFPNITPGYEVTGFDAMRGITYPVIPVSYSNQNMYWDGVHEGPVGFHQANNVQPENAPGPMTTPE